MTNPNEPRRIEASEIDPSMRFINPSDVVADSTPPRTHADNDALLERLREAGQLPAEFVTHEPWRDDGKIYVSWSADKGSLFHDRPSGETYTHTMFADDHGPESLELFRDASSQLKLIMQARDSYLHAKHGDEYWRRVPSDDDSSDWEASEFEAT